MLCPVIDNPMSCEICAVIWVFHPINVSAVKIDHELFRGLWPKCNE
jgi:hypothetical protein